MNAARPSLSRGSYDGVPAATLARRLMVPVVVALGTTGSTLDDAHLLAAAGTPDGTLVLAEAQTAGRGRSGKHWTSAPGAGIWLTLIERQLDSATISVIALRLGIAAASALDPLGDGPIGVKWPNDLYVGPAKLAGILAEARWRDGEPEWVAIGMGINLIPPPGLRDAIGLRRGLTRLDVLDVLIPALRDATSRRGALAPAELSSLAARDVARGRVALTPSEGIVDGVSAAGELVIRAPNGAVTAHRSGSLVFAEGP